MDKSNDVVEKLDQLDRDGYLLIEGALTPDETEHIRQRINYARQQGWEEGRNKVGNMWFDTLLEREPESYRPLVGHSSVRPYLEGLMGKQCQFRSFRAHINPGPYLQEWHLDFHGYWYEKEQAKKYRYAHSVVSFNTTFYFQDNGPGLGHLKFVKNGHLSEPKYIYTDVWHEPGSKFATWCDAQEHDIVYPKAGDCILFLNHIPHRGCKEKDDMERSNIVCHYQVTPMHEGVTYVSSPSGFIGTFPFVGEY